MEATCFDDRDLQLFIANIIGHDAHASLEYSLSYGLFLYYKLVKWRVSFEEETMVKTYTAVLELQTVHDGRAKSWKKTVVTLTYHIYYDPVFIFLIVARNLQYNV